MKKIAMLAAAVAMSMGVQASDAITDDAKVTITADLAPIIEIHGLDDVHLDLSSGKTVTEPEEFLVKTNLTDGTTPHGFKLSITGDHDSQGAFYLGQTEGTALLKYGVQIDGAKNHFVMSPATAKEFETKEKMDSSTDNMTVTFSISGAHIAESPAGSYKDQLTFRVTAL